MNSQLKNIFEMEKLEVTLAQQYGSAISQKEAILRGIERLGVPGILDLRSNILIEDCNESLVEIPKFIPRVENHPYLQAGAPYGKYSPFFVRESVASALIKARRKIKEIDPELDIVVYDGFRPIFVQQYMIVHTYISECAKLKIKADNLNFRQKSHLRDYINGVWAPPYTESNLPPPPHSTGGAVDLTLMRHKGDVKEELGMGVGYDGQPPETNTYHFHRKFEILEHHINNLDQSVSNPMLLQEKNDCEIILSNRNILQEAMSSAGFFNLGCEFWHFSLGDQIASLFEGLQTGNYKIAKYGKIEQSLVGAPSEETLRLYQTIFPNKLPEDKTHQQILNELIHFIYKE